MTFPPDQLGVDPLRELGVARLPELLDGVPEVEVRRPRQPVEPVEQAPGVLEHLEAADSVPRASTVASDTPSGTWCASSGPWPSSCRSSVMHPVYRSGARGAPSESLRGVRVVRVDVPPHAAGVDTGTGTGIRRLGRTPLHQPPRPPSNGDSVTTV